MRWFSLATAGFVAAVSLTAQKQDLQFDVASIKPSAPGSKLGTIRPAPGRRRYVGTSVSLKLLITVAYRVNYAQVSGPAWISDDLFDVNAEAERPSSIEDLHVMLRNMVADRFRLRMHSENKAMPAYVLTVDKGGIKMTPRDPASAGDPEIRQPGPGVLNAKSAAMDYFAWLLSLFVDKPILDKTGLGGVYDFELSWNPDLTIEPGAENTRPGLFEAVRRQLGLRLEAQNGPLPILVIDHAERPKPD